MTGDPELAVNAIRTIHDLWKVDADCVEWVGDTSAGTICKFGYGFDWWPGDFKVAIRVHGPHPELDEPVYRLSARTDFLCDVDITTADFAKGLTTLNIWAPTFSICAFPTSMAEALNKYTPPSKTSWISKLFGKRAPEKAPRIDSKSSNVWLSSNAYLDKQKEVWLPNFFSFWSILQPIEAQARADASIPLLGGREDRSQHPRLGQRTNLDDMLRFEIDIAEHGKKKSAWIGTGEFEAIVERWGRSDTEFGVAKEDWLNLEIAFGDQTAELQMIASQPHPRLGSGLFAILHLPIRSGPEEAETTCVSLNYLESTVWSKPGVPFFGNWCASERKGWDDACYYAPAFRCFMPNMMYRQGFTETVVLYMIARARWARQTLWPSVVDSPIAAAMLRRIGIEAPG